MVDPKHTERTSPSGQIRFVNTKSHLLRHLRLPCLVVVGCLWSASVAFRGVEVVLSADASLPPPPFLSVSP